RRVGRVERRLSGRGGGAGAAEPGGGGRAAGPEADGVRRARRYRDALVHPGRPAADEAQADVVGAVVAAVRLVGGRAHRAQVERPVGGRGTRGRLEAAVLHDGRVDRKGGRPVQGDQVDVEACGGPDDDLDLRGRLRAGGQRAGDLLPVPARGGGQGVRVAFTRVVNVGVA